MWPDETTHLILVLLCAGMQSVKQTKYFPYRHHVGLQILTSVSFSFSVGLLKTAEISSAFLSEPVASGDA